MRRLLSVLVLVSLAFSSVTAQQSTARNSSSRIATSLRPTPTLNSTVLLGELRSLASVTSVLSTAIPVTSSSATASQSAAVGPKLDTRIDATFGVLGALLILSGLALGTVGCYYRRSSLFVSGFYAGALVVSVLILHFGVVGRQTAPRSTARGLYLLASIVAGLVVGAFAYLFQRGGQLLQSTLAGFILGVSLLSTRSDSLIRPVGLRYVLLSGLAAVGFVSASFPKLSFIAQLVATSILGATALVLGIDCFTTAGLKEFFVYNLGFSALFPKLEGHYTFTTSITIELGVLLALAICMMAFQQRFYVLFNRQRQTEQTEETERTARAAKADGRARRQNTLQLGDWEEKYGHGQRPRSVSENGTNSTDRGKRKMWFGFGKSKKMHKGDTSLSPVVSNRKSKLEIGGLPSSVEFLPRLDLEFAQNGTSTSTLSQPTRPVLATIQSATSNQKKEGWDDYISTRQVAMADHRESTAPTRSRSSLGLTSPPSSIAKSSPRFADEDLDDDTPLALSPRRSSSTSTFSGPTRTHSSPILGSRPATMYDLSSNPSLPEAALLPRSHSRAQSLAQRTIPAVLLESPSANTIPKSESRPGTLNEAGRRATLLDLTEPSKFEPYPGRARQRTASEDRIVIGDRRKSMASVVSPKAKARESPKIMDFEDLDAKHRKRLSLLQTTATDTLATEATKTEFRAKQQAEAASQRQKDHERRRSLSSNNILLSSPGMSTDEFGYFAGGGRPKSIASLGGLFNSSKRNPSSGDLVADTSPSKTRDSLGSPATPRRQSAQSFASTSKRLSQHSLATPTRDTRRHSLTTLLETSFDETAPNVDLSPAQLARPLGPSRRTSGGLERVVEWRRSGTFASDLHSNGKQHLTPRTDQGVPQTKSAPTTPAAVEPPSSSSKKGSKKTSWLDY